MPITKTNTQFSNIIIGDAIGTPAAPGGYFGFANALGTVVASTGPRFQCVNATPNGTLVSPIGSLCIDSTTGALYRNTDGVSAWSVISAGSGGAIQTIYDSGHIGAPAATIASGVLATGFYMHRILTLSRSTTAVQSESLELGCNGDFAANYQVPFNNTGAGGTNTVGVVATASIGDCVGASVADAENFAIRIVDHIFPEDTVRWKTAYCYGGDFRDAGPGPIAGNNARQWRNVAAITGYTLRPASNNLQTGSRMIIIGFR